MHIHTHTHTHTHIYKELKIARELRSYGGKELGS